MAITKNNPKSHHYNKLGGVGLGIVVALDKPTSAAAAAGEVLIKRAVLGAPPSPRSDPIQVIRPDTRAGNNKRRICISHDQDEHEDDDDDDEENYTYLTRRGPTNSTTKVDHHKAGDDGSCRRRRSGREVDNHNRSGFLQSCDLCGNPLLGKDIYMYRGEKAFCSEECRQRQIASDERKEKVCRAEASKSSEMVSRSPCYYERGQIFSTGIIAI